MKERWSVYMIEASDGRIYTGISTDPERRLAEHAAGGARAARFFRGRKPRRIIFLESGHNRSSALRREAQIKSLSRAEKQALVTQSD
ncbi:MAG: GIY-YIG nuclease family protein [Pseudomonadota bacterium]